MLRAQDVQTNEYISIQVAQEFNQNSHRADGAIGINLAVQKLAACSNESYVD